MKQQIDYKQYLASREWRVKRKDVIEERGGICERCASRPIENIHHLTYERVGQEHSNDLMGVCRPCHEYLAAVRDDDPALEDILDWLQNHGLRPVILRPGRVSWPWPDFESPNTQCDDGPAALMMTLLPENEYAYFRPANPRMSVGPGILAIFYWL